MKIHILAKGASGDEHASYYAPTLLAAFASRLERETDLSPISPHKAQTEAQRRLLRRLGALQWGLAAVAAAALVLGAILLGKRHIDLFYLVFVWVVFGGVQTLYLVRRRIVGIDSIENYVALVVGAIVCVCLTFVVVFT